MTTTGVGRGVGEGFLLCETQLIHLVLVLSNGCDLTSNLKMF